MKKAHRARVYNFTVIFEREKDGGYHVYCPTLKGCHTQGDSFEEASLNIKEAIELYIASLKAHGEPIPEEDVLIKPVKIAV